MDERQERFIGYCEYLIEHSEGINRFDLILELNILRNINSSPTDNDIMNAEKIAGEIDRCVRLKD